MEIILFILAVFFTFVAIDFACTFNWITLDQEDFVKLVNKYQLPCFVKTRLGGFLITTVYQGKTVVTKVKSRSDLKGITAEFYTE